MTLNRYPVVRNELYSLTHCLIVFSQQDEEENCLINTKKKEELALGGFAARLVYFKLMNHPLTD